jgi:hypothetical protein
MISFLCGPPGVHSTFERWMRWTLEKCSQESKYVPSAACSVVYEGISLENPRVTNSRRVPVSVCDESYKDNKKEKKFAPFIRHLFQPTSLQVFCFDPLSSIYSIFYTPGIS